MQKKVIVSFISLCAFVKTLCATSWLNLFNC